MASPALLVLSALPFPFVIHVRAQEQASPSGGWTGLVFSLQLIELVFFKVVVSAHVGLIHLPYSSVQILDRFLYLKTWQGNAFASTKCCQIHGIHN